MDGNRKMSDMYKDAKKTDDDVDSWPFDFGISSILPKATGKGDWFWLYGVNRSIKIMQPTSELPENSMERVYLKT